MGTDTRKLTILITGGSGCVAQNIAKLLLERTDINIRELRTLDIRPFKWAKGLQHTRKNGPLFTNIEGDITKLEDVQKAMKGVDAVFHVCSLVDITPYPDIRRITAINVRGTENVIQACKDNNTEYLVYTSSTEIASNLVERVNANEEMVDKDPTEFFFPAYGVTKYTAEKLVCEAQGMRLSNGSKLSTCALRPCGVYGEGDAIHSETLFYVKNTGMHVKIGEPTGKNQWTYVGNVAWAHIKALMELMNPSSPEPLEGRFLFIGDNSPVVSPGQFIANFAEELGVYVAPITLPFWLMIIIGWFIDVLAYILLPYRRLKISVHSSTIRYIYSRVYFDWSKSKTILNYKPLFSYEEGFQRSLEYYKHFCKTGQREPLEQVKEGVFGEEFK